MLVPSSMMIAAVVMLYVDRLQAAARPGGVLMMIAAVVMLYVGIKAARSTPLGGHGGRHAGERLGPCGGPALATRNRFHPWPTLHNGRGSQRWQAPQP